MSLLSAIQDFVRAEVSDSRRSIRIFGYYPYYGYRRASFETVVASFGMQAIARRRPHARSMIARAVNPFGGVKLSDHVWLINGKDRVLDPAEGDLVLGYFSGPAADVELESIRALCHLIATAAAPLTYLFGRRALRLREVVRYYGDAIYFLWIRRLLRKARAVKLSLTVSYSHYPVIAAARSLGIHVTEYQHGAISSCHIGYSGPIGRYFPDKVIPLSPMWKDYLARNVLPIDPTTHFQGWIDRLPERSFESFCNDACGKRILVIGQETVHERLFSAFCLMQERGLSVDYRYHPRMKATHIPLSQQVDEADILVGSYSTILADFSDDKEIAIIPVASSDFLDVLDGRPNVYRLTNC